MLAFIGDIHGDFGALARIVAQIPPEATIIQVGDFGYWPQSRITYERLYADVIGRTVYFIEGNHDHVPLARFAGVYWPFAHYVGRGQVLTLQGQRILFMGGATSVDRKWRPRAYNPPDVVTHPWFPEEVVTEEDCHQALFAVRCAGDVRPDLMVTHTPPNCTIRDHFSDDGLRMFDINPRTWRDPSAENVQWLWEQLGEPPLICGHMHRSVVDRGGRVRLLNINEVYLYEPVEKDKQGKAGRPQLPEPRELPLVSGEPPLLDPQVEDGI